MSTDETTQEPPAKKQKTSHDSETGKRQRAQAADAEAEVTEDSCKFFKDRDGNDIFSEEGSGCDSNFIIKKWVYDGQSKFQKIQIIDLQEMGKVLVLDGRSQSFEIDEFIYHECLVHPAMVAQGAPKRVFIGGGGEGATAREVLRWKCVEKVVMVDIDEGVVDAAKKHLPTWHENCYDDPRFDLIIDDAEAWIRNTDQTFDVIIMDIAEPVEAGPAAKLYFQEFYEMLKDKKILNPGGSIVTQSGSGGLMCGDSQCSVINNTLSAAFGHAHSYTADVPGYCEPWSWTMTFNNGNGSPPAYWRDAEAIDKILEENVSDTSKLKMYDGQGHNRIMNLPKYIRTLFKGETRVMTKDKPVFVCTGGVAE